MKSDLLLFLTALLVINGPSTVAAEKKPLHTYVIAHDGTTASYDEAMAAASIQGIVNRTSPELYVLSRTNTRPQYWLELLSKDGRWLQGREVVPLADLAALVRLGGDRIKGAVIWDDTVPASVNVATTMAGVLDAVVLSPELAAKHLPEWKLPVLKDLRGLFTGAETGSKKKMMRIAGPSANISPRARAHRSWCACSRIRSTPGRRAASATSSRETGR